MPPSNNLSSVPTSLPAAKRPYRRILVVRYRFIGDTLMVVPFLKQLRDAYPEAVIDVLVGPYSGELLTHCPYINSLIFYDTTHKHQYENLGDSIKRSFWSYVGQLRQGHYDVAYVLKRSVSSAALAFFAGIPRRIGFDTEWRKFMLSEAVPYSKTRPEADCFMDLLRADGIPVAEDWEKDYRVDGWWSNDDDELAAAMVEKYMGGKNVLIHLTSSNHAKMWPQEQALQLINWLIHDEQATLHCLGATSDAAVYEHLRQHLPEQCRDKLLNWCGHTGLLESLAFLSRMSLMVGVDSGTLHMAAAVGVPVIALFGPMNENKWRPLGEKTTVVTHDLPCRPCNLKTPCTLDFECMTELPFEQVQAQCKIHLTS